MSAVRSITIDEENDVGKLSEGQVYIGFANGSEADEFASSSCGTTRRAAP